jgi:hypothetical protein
LQCRKRDPCVQHIGAWLDALIAIQRHSHEFSKRLKTLRFTPDHYWRRRLAANA